MASETPEAVRARARQRLAKQKQDSDDKLKQLRRKNREVVAACDAELAQLNEMWWSIIKWCAASGTLGLLVGGQVSRALPGRAGDVLNFTLGVVGALLMWRGYQLGSRTRFIAGFGLLMMGAEALTELSARRSVLPTPLEDTLKSIMDSIFAGMGVGDENDG